MRAGLVFVLVSLVVGGWFREWRRAHEQPFRDLIDELESRGPAPGGAALVRPGALPSGGPDKMDIASGQSPAPTLRRVEVPLAPGRLDVDHAGAPELERLPGIGPALAARIVADRERIGPFRGPEGLLRVRGIGPRTLERIRPYLAPPSGAAADSVSPNAN